MPLANRFKTNEPERTGVPRPAGHLPTQLSNEAIVRALLEGRSIGGAALYDRYHRHVRRVLARIMGPEDVRDSMQDVFLEAVRSIARLQDPDALPGWLTTIAARTATSHIKRRARLRWFPLFPTDELPEVAASVASPEIDAAARATYRVLGRLPAEERVAFALRCVDGMELVDVARACGVSLATIKRRLHRAVKKFGALARREPDLAEWIHRGDRWS
jgi:RNA polymerase sigma-70 factor (ECF subfamily)